MLTYEYLDVYDPAIFDQSEREEIDAWFIAAGAWFHATAIEHFDILFEDRLAGDYTPTAHATDDDWRAILYQTEDGEPGTTALRLHRRYNNRIAVAERAIAFIGVKYGDEELQKESARFVREFLRYGYYPEGVISEFERGSLDHPSSGVKYGWETVGTLGDIADVFARAGNPELYEYKTTGGAFGTAGMRDGHPKTLESLVVDMYRYVTGDFQRWVAFSDTDIPRYQIGPVDEVWGRNWIHDGMMQNTNRYFKNSFITEAYTRQADGAPPYPQDPSGSQGDPEGGAWGIYPGIAFMFGQLEEAAPPYPTS